MKAGDEGFSLVKWKHHLGTPTVILFLREKKKKLAVLSIKEFPLMRYFQNTCLPVLFHV